MTRAGTTRPGGRTARTAQAVFAATLDELSSRPYDEISIETIAARAGVHKTTIYRRWATKTRLIAQALEIAAEVRIEVPDTGTLGGDLRALAGSVAATLSSRQDVSTLLALLTGAANSAEIRTTVQRFWATRMQHDSVIVTRGIARRELPAGTDPTQTLSALVAPLYYRLLVTGEPLTQPAIDLSVTATLAAAEAGTFASADQPAS